MLLKLSIKRLFIMVYIIVGLLIMMLGAGAFRELKAVSEIANKMYQHPFAVSNAVLEANLNIVSMHRYMKDVALARNEVALSNATQLVKKHEKRVYQNLDIMLERFLGDKSKIISFRKTFDAWKAIRTEVIRLTKAGKYNEAAEITKGKGAEHVALLTRQMDGLISFARNKAATFIDDGQNSYAQSVLQLKLLLIFVLIVIAGFLFIFLKKIEKSEEKLLHSENLKSNILSSIPELVWMKDLNGKYLTCNPNFEQFFGADQAHILGKTDHDFVSSELADFFIKNDQKVLEANKPLVNEEWVTYATDGRKVLLETTKTPLKSDDGTVIGVLGVGHDITERHNNEQTLRFLNQSLKMISKANEALVYAKTEPQLLDDVCRILITEGGYRMAWIGTVENSPDKRVKPVAQCGYEDGYLEKLDISLDKNAPTGQGPTAKAIRTGKPQLNSDTVKNPYVQSWKEDALKRGYMSSIALPMILDGQAIGALNIYAATTNAFTDKNIPLLMEMVADLAYGISSLRLRQSETTKKALLRWSSETEKSLAEISRNILYENITIEKISSQILEHAQILTGSNAGFAGYIDPKTGFLVCPAVCENIDDVSKLDKTSLIIKKFEGMFDWIINRKTTISTNDFKNDPRSFGSPPHHLFIKNFLSVPALAGNELFGQITIANARHDYSEKDQALLERMGTLYAIALQRVRSIELIKESEQRYRELFETSEISIWNVDLTGVIKALDQIRQEGVTDLCHYLHSNKQSLVYIVSLINIRHVNNATINLFGADTEDHFINNVDQVFSQISTETFIDQFCAIWDKKHYFRSEVVCRNFNDQEIHTIISFKIPPTKEAYSNIAVSVTDITERYEIEQQLWQNQKVESIGNIAGGIAHDINNLLLPVKALTNMALKDVPKGSKSHKRLQVVLEASEQVKDLVSRILSFSRKEEFHKEKINLAKCIRSGIKLLRSTVPSSLIIRPHIKNIGDVFADQTQINVVLVNLAVNARDAMVGGTGEMSISLTKHIATKMDAALPNIKENAPYAVIRVKDSGCGMTKDVLPRVFDPFFTTKPPGEGTGLGLSIVYGVVARHDGGIRIRSKEGKGTTFEIFLPFFG